MKQKETGIHLEQAIRAESESTLILLLTLLQIVSLKAGAENVTNHEAAMVQEARGRFICPEMIFQGRTAEVEHGDYLHSSCLT